MSKTIMLFNHDPGGNPCGATCVRVEEVAVLSTGKGLADTVTMLHINSGDYAVTYVLKNGFTIAEHFQTYRECDERFEKVQKMMEGWTR